MGTFFKIVNKAHTSPVFHRYVKAPVGGQVLYSEVTDIVGEEKRCQVNDIPLAIEIDGWGELACIGETYETDDLLVECISEEEFEKF